MRVALFGDVHGNPHALDATWEDIQSHTTPDNKACLRGLVPEIRFEVGGTRVLLFHGSPRKMNGTSLRTGRSRVSSAWRRPHRRM